VTYEQYGPPPNFNFDIFGPETPQWVNNERSEDFNADSRAQEMIEYLKGRAEHYATDEIFVLFGEDF